MDGGCRTASGTSVENNAGAVAEPMQAIASITNIHPCLCSCDTASRKPVTCSTDRRAALPKTQRRQARTRG